MPFDFMYNSQSYFTDMMAGIFCPKCNCIPQVSFVAGQTFNTHICYDRCGNVFWTLKVCPNCKDPEKTLFLKKPNFGQKITCANCKSKMYYFRCPENECLSLFYKCEAAYIMGSRLYCQTCRHEYKTIVCPCGGEVRFDKAKTLMQGHDIFKCKCCKKDLIYTLCPQCNQPEYHVERLQIGERIRCSSCKTWRKYVPCPQCGRTLKGTKFSYCEVNNCEHCKASFQYSRCPYGCGINFYMTNRSLGPVRNCNACRHVYSVINCSKCQNTVYLESIDKSIGVIDNCPSCRNVFKFYLCPCGLFNTEGASCVNPKCGKPSQVIDRTKKQQQKSKAKEGEEEMLCKICYADLPVMINEACGHLMMCEKCVTDYRRSQKGSESMPCPVCKTIGKFFKYKEPIYS